VPLKSAVFCGEFRNFTSHLIFGIIILFKTVYCNELSGDFRLETFEFLLSPVVNNKSLVDHPVDEFAFLNYKCAFLTFWSFIIWITVQGAEEIKVARLQIGDHLNQIVSCANPLP